MDPDLGNLTILMTGGTGFVGRSLLRRWLTAEKSGRVVPRVTVVSRNPRGFLERHGEFANLPWLEYHAGDILEPSSLPHGQSFSHVMHLAADSTLGPRLPPAYVHRQIVEGTRNVLDLAVRSAAERFLFVSSGAVYGKQPLDLDVLPETWDRRPSVDDPRSTYGLAKLGGENLCTLYQSQFGLQTVVARCFAFVGPDLALDAHFAVGNFIRDALWRDEILISGDGRTVRSYLYQEDLAIWLNALLMRGAPGRAYNVGSDQAVTIFALAEMIRECLSPGKPIHVLGHDDAQSEATRYVPDVSRIRKELGVQVSIPLPQAISLTAEQICDRQHPGETK